MACGVWLSNKESAKVMCGFGKNEGFYVRCVKD